MDVEIKVTFIKNKWHARLFKGDTVYDEMACSMRSDIGWICREMLRWYDKSGGCSKFAHAARLRQHSGPTGQVWYHGELMRSKRNKESN